MRVLVLGAAGMVGMQLCRCLLADGRIGSTPISRLTAFDLTPASLEGATIRTGDIADPATVRALIAGRPDVIFHLAAVVSGEAEADFEKGYRINLDGSRDLFEAIRAEMSYCPRLVYASSIGVFGAPFDEPVADSFVLTPLTSYGTQKAICELLLNDYTRRGVFDGIGLRLPAVVVRPGPANKAASGFFSAIMREPLAGREAVLPVAGDVLHWLASPDATAAFLIHAAAMDLAPLGSRRCLTMPGLAITVDEMIDTLRRVAGGRVAGLIRRQPDQAIAAMVAGWPRRFAANRALAAGFMPDTDFEAVLRAHIRAAGV